MIGLSAGIPETLIKTACGFVYTENRNTLEPLRLT
jgi:hypothetical protein